MNPMNRLLLLAVAFLIGTAALPAQAPSRIKDLAMVKGVQNNQLYGYGFVTGLAGQGDSDPISTQQTVSNFLKKFGVNVTAQNIKAKNTAAVMITATIKSGASVGSPLDIIVSSMSDAKSLQGGTLAPTVLWGADGNAYAQAQGPLSLGGAFLAAGGGGGASASVMKNHPTVGDIPNGATVVREIPTDYFSKHYLELALKEGDFTSAVRMANAINEQIAPIAEAVSNTTVRVYVPAEARPEQKQIEFIARVENVIFCPDVAARVVMNEKTGTIVMNSWVKIGSVAVTHGNMTVSILNTQNVSQPNPGTGNTTVVPGATSVSEAPVTDGHGNTVYIDPTTGNKVLLGIGQAPPPGYQVMMANASVSAAPAATAPNGTAGPVVAGGPATAITGATTAGVELIVH